MAVFGWRSFYEARLHKRLSPSSVLRHFNTVNITPYFLKTYFNFVPPTTLCSTELSLLFRYSFVCCYTAHEPSFVVNMLYVILKENPFGSSNLFQNPSEAKVSALPQAFDDLCTLLNHFASFTLRVI